MFIKIVKTIKNGIKIKKIYFLNKVFFFEYIGKRVDKKEIFFGLIKTLRAKYHIPQIKILKLMNIPIIKSFRKDFIEKIYFFNILFKTKDHRYDFLNKYKKYIKR